MAITAVTGDIGSGKSLVSRMLAEKLSCPLFDADIIAKDLWNDEAVKAQAKLRWGDKIFASSGKIITSKLAEFIFSSETNHKFCDDLIHPLVMQKLRELTQNLECSVIEIPLLPEAGRPSWIDKALYVTAGFDLRAERCRIQRGWSIEELRRRESFLLEHDYRISICDDILHNDKSIKELERMIEIFIKEKI